MTFAAAALLGLTMGQPLTPDYYPMKSRTIKLPIEYKQDRKTIRQVTLYVSRNGENTWTQEGFVTPDKDAFVYVAKDDGIYWFKMQIEDLKGNKDPVDVTRDVPDLKMVVDTVAPVIRVTGAKRTGNEIVIEWSITDKFPNDAATKVFFRASNNADGFWQEVTLPAGSRTGVKFPSGISEGVTVKVATADVAGNPAEVTQDFPAGNGASTSLKEQPPYTGPAPGPDGKGGGLQSLPHYRMPPAETGMGAIAPPAPVGVAPIEPGPGPIAPILKPDPVVPISPGPGSVQPTLPLTGGPPIKTYPPYQPLVTENIGAPLGGNPPPAGGPQPLPVYDPKAVPVNPPAHSTTQTGWNGVAPAAELTRAKAINYPRFDLGFDLEQHGPSGISRVDLWVTRDEGRNWTKWSQHDGKGGAVRVALDVKENPRLEGNYGFRLVPVSGAGLSEREPVAGDAPDMRVVLDVTAPQIDLYAPASDPNALDTLVIQWKATDSNFGDDPITLEWSDSATGPWKPVATTGGDPVVQATAVSAPIAKRLANTGQYAWRVPTGVPARVYLKATARDAANNVREVVTREPILVDLTKPRAKINGIVPPVAIRP